MKKILLPNNLAVIEGDSHLTEWVKQSGRLDHDPMIQTLTRYIAPGTVALDVGASIGDHAAGYLKSQAYMVAAFEPNPVAYECLVHNCPNAMAFNYALGNEISQRFLRLNAPNYGASFLIDVAELTFDDSPQTAPPVQVMRLDSIRFPRRISFIKVDIEGYESEFLLGADKTIERDRPVICMEVNEGRLKANGVSSSAALLQQLHLLGYNTQPVPGTNEHPLQWDVLAIPT